MPPQPLPALLTDATGSPVRLAEPDRLTAPPAYVAVDGADPVTVTGWAGPWPVRQRWWAPDAVVSARLQIVLDDDTALLLLHGQEQERWVVIGVYD